MKKSILISFVSLIIFSFLISSAEEVEKPTISIIYPLPGSEVKVQEGKTFLFGQVHPFRSKLFINGEQIKTDEDGAFIHYTNVVKMDETKSLQINDSTIVPVNGYFELKAEIDGIEEKFNYYVKVIDELKTSPSELLEFDNAYEESPSSNLKLQQGETFFVSVKGTPGCQAYFTIDGLKEKFPMIEIYKFNEFFLSEAIFGSGFRFSKDTIKGIYEGHLILPQLGNEYRTVTVHLVHPKLGGIKKVLKGKISTFNSNQYDVIEIILIFVEM
ncbi:MAG: hypothetical protein N3A61_00580, partial [Ignavibacteria bacterium]|nr:hypothetical protein [Ignavibacteria bacterium]